MNNWRSHARTHGAVGAAGRAAVHAVDRGAAAARRVFDARGSAAPLWGHLHAACAARADDPDERSARCAGGLRGPTWHVRPSAASTFPIVGEHSLFLIEGRRHVRDRQLLGPTLHGSRVLAFADRSEVVEQHLDGWRVGRLRSMNRLLKSISLEVIVRVVFRADEPRHVEEYQVAIERFMGSSTPLALLRRCATVSDRSARGPSLSARGRIFSLIDTDVAAVAALDRRTDMLATLQAARDEDGNPCRSTRSATSWSPWCWWTTPPRTRLGDVFPAPARGRDGPGAPAGRARSRPDPGVS